MQPGAKPKRNANRPCDDEVDDDKHLAEDGRTRCTEHHARRRAAIKARSDAKAAGIDVSGPEWELPGPSRRERPAATAVLPERL